MSASMITKNALAEALKMLLKEEPFDKISVGNICESCGLSRKSFYYHFKDKYDLVNWIYHREFSEITDRRQVANNWELLKILCDYFYEHREFYRKIFMVDGQNSFSDHFREIVILVLSPEIEEMFKDEASIDFFINFYVDAFVCAIKRWIGEKNCMPATAFLKRLKRCLLVTSDRIVQDFSEKKE